MLTGDIKKIDLSTSSFERLITTGQFYVDKTALIEHFLNASSQVNLITRQRRMGKSLNMDMVRCFLTGQQDMRHLFKGLYIEKSPVWEKVSSAPVFYFDFKTLTIERYRQQIVAQVFKHVQSITDIGSLTDYSKWLFDNLTSNPDSGTDGLFILTEIAYEVTGKRSYLLIDEYDNLLMRHYNSAKYEEIRDFETALLSAALKGNNNLEKALLTGVMRISHESMLSGLNNIVTHDVFGDEVYTDDYGLTDKEIESLCKLTNTNMDEIRTWYNGITIGGHAIYNIYSVMSYLAHGKFDCYWGKSGTMSLIVDLLNDNRKATIARLLNGEKVEVGIANRISLRHLSDKSSDQAFYSLLVQAGYLALHENVPSLATTTLVSIPNTELMMVWKGFILESLYTDTPKLKTLFDNTNDLNVFASNVEYFLRDRLSYHDLATYKGDSQIQERLYHMFLLGILSAYDDVRCGYPLSNRESGDGRYDVLVKKPEANFIFEFKACDSVDDLNKKAKEALKQIETKRYGADLDSRKRLIQVGVAFHGKLCAVICGE